MKKLFAAIAVASLTLSACGSTTTDPNEDDTFTVGMECNYALLTGKRMKRQILPFL